MSAQQTFAYCLDCRELHYGVSDKNGVYTRDSASTNHDGHRVHVFTKPDDYGFAAPIRNTLTKLHAGLPITDNEIVMFKLAACLEGLGDPDEMARLARLRKHR